MNALRIAAWAAAALAALAAVVPAVIWLLTFHPRHVEDAPVTCPAGAPALSPGQRLKVLTWNVQFMAGKGHVFFFDLLDGRGPDERPTRTDVSRTLAEVARVVRDEAPDVLLLQEVDDGAARTDHEDQLARLLERLPPEYACRTTAFYWKAAYVPHARIRGSVGMKLAIVSRYRIASARRHQLSLIPTDVLTRQFNLKRAVLEARLPVEGGGAVAVLATHLDAFAQGTDTMARQVSEVGALLADLSRQRIPWVIGGDFNLLPPGPAYERLAAAQRAYFNPSTEAAPLFERYRSVPSPEETSGPDAARWFTHFPNDPSVGRPDRTIDYLFVDERVQLRAHRVRQDDTREISDHFPVIAEVQLP